MSVDPTAAVRLAQRYTLRERIAVGGMGEVHLATDERLRREVAVKVLGRAFSEAPESVERFRREALTAAGLVHPTIAQVYDYGVDGDSHFIVMEYVPGADLAHVLRERGRLTPAQAVDVAAQVCTALAVAHRAGVVHRDIKPGNVILTDDGRVKVTDFGIARARGHAPLTDAGAVMGTAAYLPPEQARGETATPASDIYSLGILLYQMLTGRVPFSGDTPVAIALRHLDEPVPPPSSVVADLPAALDEVVARATAKAPGDRYADAEELARALRHREAAAHEATRAMAAITDVTALLDLRDSSGSGLTGEGGRSTDTATHQLGAVTSRRTDREDPDGADRRRVALLWGAAVAAVVIVVVLLLSRLPQAPATTETPPRPAPSPSASVTPAPSDAPTETAEPATPTDPETSAPADEPGTLPRGLVGRDVKDVEEALEELGLRHRTVDVRSRAPKGQVLALHPSGGAEVEDGQTVVVIASRGETGDHESDDWVMPDWVIGAPGDALEERLEGRDVKVVRVPVASDQPEGTVVATWPAPGARVRFGQIVVLTSSGESGE